MATRQVFRCSFWYLWSRLSMLCGGIVVVSTIFIQIAKQESIFQADNLAYMIIISTLLIIFTGIIVWLHVYSFPIVFDENGITGHTHSFPNRKHLLHWTELATAQKTKHLGLPCYRLRSQNRDVALIIPSELTDKTGFAVALKEHGIKITEIEPLKPQPQTRMTKRSESVTAIRANMEMIRENGYLIITTEQRSSKSR